MECTIPELSTEKALRFSADINTMNLSGIHEMVFQADMNWVRPFGMLLASSAIKQLRKSNPDIPFRMQCASNKAGTSYAAHMGFFKSISESITVGNAPGEASGNDNYLPITELDLQQLHMADINAGLLGSVGDTIERESAGLSKILCRNNSEILAIMTYLIREILRNISEHSNSSIAWICGQYWSDGTAEIAILDEGIGIRQSLQKNIVHRQYIVDDETALRSSIKAGISQAFSPFHGNKSDDVWANSGFGLYMVSEICKKLQGSFCIASGDSFLKISNSGIIPGETCIKGTAIKITFSTKQLNNSSSIIREIASNGELEAKTIKNAFKKASHPSKGLILEL